MDGKVLIVHYGDVFFNNVLLPPLCISFDRWAAIAFPTPEEDFLISRRRRSQDCAKEIGGARINYFNNINNYNNNNVPVSGSLGYSRSDI